MHRTIVDKQITIEGFPFSPMMVNQLVIYRCRKCGRTALPEYSKDRLKKIKQELFSAENGNNEPVA